jgi:tryptophan 2-monooxygenase
LKKGRKMSAFVKPEPIRATPVTPDGAPATFIDVLYDHVAYLRFNDGKIARANMSGKHVAVVGAGAAGLLAGYQLLGLQADVTIFEASSRAGGRIETYYPIAGSAAAYEMGAMRVPPCQQLFNYYADRFGLKPGGQFPDPGQVDTRLIYRNQSFAWPAGSNPPAIFNKVSTAWGNFADSYSELTDLLTNPTAANLAKAQRLWQAAVYSPVALGPETGLSTISFYQGLIEQFVENYADWGIAQPWNGDDFELFGTLGLGSGGFGPLYEVNFAEMVRLVVNGLESHQQFYPDGLSKLIDGFVRYEPCGLSLGSRIRYDSRVTGVTRGRAARRAIVTLADGTSHEFDAVIVATSHRSMQVEMGISDPYPQPPSPLIDPPTASAIRELHLMNSSKLFVTTKNKFWQDPGSSLPANIQSDTLARGLYCLDYHPGTGAGGGHGVVLVSYTWGDDSSKYLAVKDPEERLQIVLRSLQPCAADFVSALQAAIVPDTVRLVDWQDERGYYGAFKVNYPGQDQYNQETYYQFLKGGPVYLAGDSIGWCGGWVESALQTGMNAAAAVVRDLMGQDAMYPGDPTTQVADIYQYGPPVS